MNIISYILAVLNGFLSVLSDRVMLSARYIPFRRTSDLHQPHCSTVNNDLDLFSSTILIRRAECCDIQRICCHQRPHVTVTDASHGRLGIGDERQSQF